MGLPWWNMLHRSNTNGRWPNRLLLLRCFAEDAGLELETFTSLVMKLQVRPICLCLRTYLR